MYILQLFVNFAAEFDRFIFFVQYINHRMNRFLATTILCLMVFFQAFAQEDATNAADTVQVKGKSSVAAATYTQFDVNNDGAVNVVDIVDIVKFTKGSPRSVFKVAKADVNGDGQVNINDAKALSLLLTNQEVPVAETTPEMTGDSLQDPEAP